MRDDRAGRHLQATQKKIEDAASGPIFVHASHRILRAIIVCDAGCLPGCCPERALVRVWFRTTHEWSPENELDENVNRGKTKSS